MFSKGSRYRNLPESSLVNVEGERLRGKDLRIILPTPGRFLHTVQASDRLDLLAFKYYGDATRWWQISDANPGFPFPTDLLDPQPIVEERFVLTHSDFELRFEALRVALSGPGSVKRLGKTIFVAGSEVLLAALNDYGVANASEPDFLESVVTVIYGVSAPTRTQILQQLQDKKFHLLRTFTWTIGTNTAEAFSFDDQDQVRSSWRTLVTILATTPGLLEVESTVAESALRVVYNSAMVAHETILALLQKGGFVPESTMSSQVGAKIVIPPNQIV
jgi:hypothetical protein